MHGQVNGQVSVNQNPPKISLRCPSCRRNGMFEALIKADAVWSDSDRYVDVRIGSRYCPNNACRAFVFVVVEGNHVTASYPAEFIDFDATNLPPAILASFEEAIKCHAAGCYRASALMVRRVLEELCADKNANGNNLKEKLSALSGAIVVPPDLLAAADELRLLGNDAAHIEAKSYDSIGTDELAIAIDLTKELLKGVYQYSSLLDRLRSLKRDE